MTEKPSECDVQDTAFSESAECTTNIMEVCESDAGTPSGSNTNTASIKIKLEETDTADNIKDLDIATVNIKAELPSAGEIDNVQIKQENYGDSESEEEMDIKSEGEDYEDIDDGLLTSKTSMNVTDIDLKDHVKKEIDECEISDEGDFESGINDGVKIEDETVVKYLHSEFDEKFSTCEHSDEDYQSYCTKCRMLVYILDNNVPNNTDDKAIEEIPKDILEIRQSSEHSGIFALKTIPEGVRFGPFMGVNSSDNTWKIKGGKFVVNDENVKFLNWMQHINPAKNILEHNLLAFEHEDNIYYGSMREIQEGEELLVYFGEEYEDSLNNDVEVEFMPHPETNVEDVFACTLCCLGFNSAIHLAKHKTVCPNKTEGSFLNKDIMQCPHCKIYLEQWEYLEHHMTYCREKNYRRQARSDQNATSKSITSDDLGGDVERAGTFECFLCEHEAKDKSQLDVHLQTAHFKDGKFRCTRCEYGTVRKNNLKLHLARHERMKRFKCKQCDFATLTKQLLKIHQYTHKPVKQFKCTQCAYSANRKCDLEKHMAEHDKVKRFKCTECDYKTHLSGNFKRHAYRHQRTASIKCPHCDFTAKYECRLARHVVTHEAKELKCMLCDYVTREKTGLKLHLNSAHADIKRFKCSECEFATNTKANLRRHAYKHKTDTVFKCSKCDYTTNQKRLLKQHSNTHATEKRFKCTECEFATHCRFSYREHNDTHDTVKQFQCSQCYYATNIKWKFKLHSSTHESVKRLKCSKCKFRTNNKASLNAHVCKATITSEANEVDEMEMIEDDVLIGIV